jgi:hypothetical protein
VVWEELAGWVEPAPGVWAHHYQGYGHTRTHREHSSKCGLPCPSSAVAVCSGRPQPVDRPFQQGVHVPARWVQTPQQHNVDPHAFRALVSLLPCRLPCARRRQGVQCIVPNDSVSHEWRRWMSFASSAAEPPQRHTHLGSRVFRMPSSSIARTAFSRADQCTTFPIRLVFPLGFSAHRDVSSLSAVGSSRDAPNEHIVREPERDTR